MKKTKRHPDSPVPESDQLACALWKCWYNTVNGPSDGTVTWWTLQPITRKWWRETADRFQESEVFRQLLKREAS
jgi:hypothetical protein